MKEMDEQDGDVRIRTARSMAEAYGFGLEDAEQGRDPCPESSGGFTACYKQGFSHGQGKKGECHGCRSR